MSFKFDYMRRLVGSGLHSTHIHVAVAVWNHADEHGRKAWPGNARLVDETGLSESTVKRSLRELKAAGWLRQESRGSRVKGKASEYALTLPAIPVTHDPYSAVNDEPNTGHLETQYRSSGDSIQVTHDPPSDPLTPDPLTPDPLSVGDIVDWCRPSLGRAMHESARDEVTSLFAEDFSPDIIREGFDDWVEGALTDKKYADVALMRPFVVAAKTRSGGVHEN